MKNMMIFVFAAFVALATAVPLPVPVREPKHTDDFLTFWDFHKMEHYLEHLNEDHDMVTVETIGTTFENRPIQAVRVSLPHSISPAHHRQTILIESGLHAREWVAPMVNLYMIHMLVEHHPEYSHILENVDFVFIPMANPDGYEYSHNVDRNWNKNRRFVGRNCYGVDLNRNFDFEFRPHSDPCDEHYAGISPASEAETRAIQNYLEKHGDNIKMYVSLQAYGQQILAPYNYAPISGDNHEESIALAEEVAKEIHTFNGRTYTYGIGARLLEEPERGTSSDYAHGVRHIPLAYTVKLPAGGETGYDVSEEQLDGILTESWFGFLKLAEHLTPEDIVPYPN